MTYTTFDYSDLKLDKDEYGVDGTIRASFTLTNSGKRKATEIVELYTTDLVASVSPSVADLRRFERVTLEPGESRRVDFSIPVSELAFVGHDLAMRVEPGEFILRVGPDSESGIEKQFVVK